MSKGIHSDNDSSAWAVVFTGSNGGIETVMCDSEESALVYAWFNSNMRGRPQIMELPLVHAEQWREGGDDKFSAEGIPVTRRWDKQR